MADLPNSAQAVDTSTAAVLALMDGVTDGPWKREPMGGSSIILAPALPPRNDTRADYPYGYGGDKFCLGYPFIDDMRKSTRMDFVSFGHADARFIAASRQLVPALLAERDAATTRAEQAEARERALIEGTEINRQALLRHNADHAAQVAALTARVAELEGDRPFIVGANHGYETAMQQISESEVMNCIEIVDEHFDSALADRARAALAGEGVE